MKSTCRNCGYDLVEREVVVDAVQELYLYTEAELQDGPPSVRVWCPDCAVADGRIDEVDESASPDFHWEVSNG